MIKLHNFSEQPSLICDYVAEMRDVNIQTDSLRFRRNIERTGELMAYEISKMLHYENEEIVTPLGKARGYRLADKVVLGTILRAGLPFHQGFLSYFDRAENAFVSAYRKYKDALRFDIHIEYIACPSLEGKVLLLSDPMLATGSSMEMAFRALLTHGTPSAVHIASIIASKPAIAYLNEHLPTTIPITLWTAALDNDIDAHSYIVPGLGDAGDLAYGEKM